MRRSVSVGVLAAVGVLAGAVCHAVTPNYKENRSVSTAAGHEVKIGRYSTWGNFCEYRPTNVITKTAPEHGTISTRLETYVSSGGARTGTIDCTGKTMQGVAVYYMPQAGFRGHDQVQLQVPSGNGTMSDTIGIDVN